MADTKKTSKASKKMVTPKDLKTLTKEELVIQAKEVREEAVILKRNSLLGDVQNIRAYKYKRRELARILTLINAKPATVEEK